MVKRKQSFQPVVIYDAMGYIRQYFLAAEAEGETVRVVVLDTTRPYLHSREILMGQMGRIGQARYIVSEKEPATLGAQMKARALSHGATPEAFRLIGLVTPFSKEESNTMTKTDKLAPKRGNAEELKAAAKKTPVGGAAAKSKKTGNPEALAKARAVNAGKTEAMRAKKIKALKKPKEIEARAGSFRHTMLTDLLGSKTVGEFYDKTPADSKSKYDAGCIRFAEGAGYVELA